MKTLTLLTLATLTVSTAFAQKDPVIEQINITKDAVGVALDEITRGGTQTVTSADAENGIKDFSVKAAAALKTFEEKVRVRVLQSFSVMINQYNNTINNKSLSPEAKKEILESLYKQILVVAMDKSQVYKLAYLELYSVLPDIPVQYDMTPVEWNQQYIGDGKYIQYPKFLHDSLTTESVGKPWDRRQVSTYHYSGDVYYAKSGNRKTNYSSKEYYNGYPSYNKVVNLMNDAQVEPAENARRKLLTGCFSSTCYFQMQSQYTIWKSMIEASLSRDINITLQDGKKITITKDVSRKGYSYFILDTYLTNINTEGLINNLPFETSPERFGILSKMDSVLSGGKCRNTRALTEDLCTKTQEGCLKPSEVALLQDRHGANASCLGGR